MADRIHSTHHLAGDSLVGLGACVDGGYAWRWQWTWSTAGAMRTW